MSDEEKMTKVHVDLPNHRTTGGESMWAGELGKDLYELRNVPFYAYGLNFGDVVRATPDAPDLKPEIRDVVRRSGNRTLRLFFDKAVAEEKRFELLKSLSVLAVWFERATASHFALDLEPHADIDEIRTELDRWERQGWIGYATCEARVKGSFDDAPGESETPQ